MTKQPNLTLTKADLIEEVLRITELPRKESETIVETIFDSIIGSLQKGEKIEIRGFGSFRTRDRRGRVGRNPKTGEKVEVPAKKIPFFKPSKELKDFVNNSAAPAAAASEYPRQLGQVPFPSRKIQLDKENCATRQSAGLMNRVRSRRRFWVMLCASFLGRKGGDGLSVDSLALSVHGAGDWRQAARLHFLRRGGEE